MATLSALIDPRQGDVLHWRVLVEEARIALVGLGLASDAVMLKGDLPKSIIVTMLLEANVSVQGALAVCHHRGYIDAVTPLEEAGARITRALVACHG